MRRLLVVIFCLVAVPSAAMAAPYKLRAGKYGVQKIGPFNIQVDARVPAAIRAFGTPQARYENRGGCTVYWGGDLRLRIDFYNFGAPTSGICEDGYAQSFRTTGRRIVSWNGLRVGHREQVVERKHGNAEQHGPVWWLKRAYSPFGDGSAYGVVRAKVTGNKVRGFDGWIGAAGE